MLVFTNFAFSPKLYRTTLRVTMRPTSAWEPCLTNQIWRWSILFWSTECKTYIVAIYTSIEAYVPLHTILLYCEAHFTYRQDVAGVQQITYSSNENWLSGLVFFLFLLALSSTKSWRSHYLQQQMVLTLQDRLQVEWWNETFAGSHIITELYIMTVTSFCCIATVCMYVCMYVWPW